MTNNSFRVVSLWSTEVSNFNQSTKSNIWGLGDLIRGTFQLYQICRKHNFSFDLDFNNHPISQIMIERPEQKYKYASKVNFHLFLNTLEMEKFVLKAALEEKKELFIMTNGCLPLSSVYANQFKIFINRYFQLKSEYQKLLENSLPSPKSYEVLHIRLGDDYLIDKKNLITKSIKKVLKSNINRNTILISDSIYLKNYAKFKFSVRTLSTQPTHFGLKIDAKRTFDNYLEFNILRGASNIKTFSNYSWISGFVYIPSIIYGIPLRNLKDKKKIKIIIYKLNIFRYKLINLIRKFRRILIYK